MRTWTVIITTNGVPIKTETLPVRWVDGGMIAMREGARHWITHLRNPKAESGFPMVPSVETSVEAVLWR